MILRQSVHCPKKKREQKKKRREWKEIRKGNFPNKERHHLDRSNYLNHLKQKEHLRCWNFNLGGYFYEPLMLEEVEDCWITICSDGICRFGETSFMMTHPYCQHFQGPLHFSPTISLYHLPLESINLRCVTRVNTSKYFQTKCYSIWVLWGLFPKNKKLLTFSAKWTFDFQRLHSSFEVQVLWCLIY